jgi:hypothetical protein
MENYIKKDSNYTIPPIGPLVKRDLSRDQTLLFLNFAIRRINELEKSDKPLSYMEYEDLSMFLYYCIGDILYEKENAEHYFFDKIISKAYNKLINLYETRKIYIDIPIEFVKIIIDNTLHLSIHYRRNSTRCSIQNILDYLNENDNISDQILDQIKDYIDKVLELEIFSKTDLIPFFPDKFREKIFKN